MADPNAQQAKGNLKQAAGDALGDEDMKNEGRVDEAQGKAEQGVDKLKDGMNNLADKARDAVNDDKK